MDARVREVIDAWNRADSDRGTWKNHWQQITELCLPERNDYTVERAPGMKRNQAIFNETPEFALTQFANGLHSMLTSPTLLWFMLHLDDERLNKRQDVKLWLEAASYRLYEDFSGPSRNFASQSHELYLDLGSIGTGCMAVLETQRRDVLFSTRHLKEVVVLENDEDRVDAAIRRWWYTPKQAVQRWGAAAGDKAWKLYSEGNNDKRLYFFHQVRPRKERNLSRFDSKSMPFESLYVSEEDGLIIDEGGFEEFPYMVPRFSKTAGEIYGRGPGMTMLPLMKMLNEATKLVIKAAQKVIDPPLQIPDDGYLLPIKTVPGSQNFFRSNSPAQARITPIQTGGRIDIGDDMINRLEQKLMRGFYVEWMGMPVGDPNDPMSAGKGVTATFTLEERDKKMRLLSPLLARLQSEFLTPLIERDFAIRWRQSVAMRFGPGSPFPPPPAIMQGQRWHAEYLSPLAIAQRSSQLDSVSRLLATQMQLKQMSPNSIDIVDHDAVMRITSDDLHAPAAVLKTPEALQAEQAAQAKAAQAAAAADAAKSAGSAIKDGSQGLANLASAGNA